MPQQGYPNGQMPQQGYPNGQMPQQGYPNGQMPQQGYPNGQMPQQGYPNGQMPQQGYPNGQMPQQGYPNGQMQQPAYPYPVPYAYPQAAQKAGLGKRIAGLIVLIVGILFSLISVLVFAGKMGKEETTARIIQIREESEGDHKVTVAYEANKRYYQADLNEWHSNWVTGQELKIKYDPKDPTKIVYAGHLIEGIFGGIGVGLIALGIFLRRKPKPAGYPMQPA